MTTYAGLSDDMFETMYSSQGVGLAATQVDFHQRLFIADCSDNQDEPLVFINPEIIERDGIHENEEGCLSFPGVYAKVERASEIVVRALDRDGNSFDRKADGLLAICIQHEIDHLNGKLFCRLSFATEARPNSQETRKRSSYCEQTRRLTANHEDSSCAHHILPEHLTLQPATCKRYSIPATSMWSLFTLSRIVPPAAAKKLQASAVKELALAHDLPVEQPLSFKK